MPRAAIAPYGALARTLDLWDAGIVRTLDGVQSTHLLTWVPAIELAWLGGMTDTKREHLLRFILSRHGSLPHQVQRLLRGWLTRGPSDAFFQAARHVLVTQLLALPVDERPAFVARIIGPCMAIASPDSGGLAGISPAERGWLTSLMHDLAADGRP